MSFTDSTTISYKTPYGTVSQFGADEPGNLRQTPSATVPGSTSNYHLAVSTVHVSQLVSFLIYSDQDVTIRTNSPTTPSQTFTLEAGIGLTWNASNGVTNPLTVDITDLYITNYGSAAADVQTSFLQQ